MIVGNKLIKPIIINDINIPTKFFLAPINTGFARDGNPTDKLINFQNQRSGNLIGISYIGNVAIGKEYITNMNNTYFTNKLDKWKILSKIIKKNGSIPAIQLGCRYSKIIPNREAYSKFKEQYINSEISEIKSISKMQYWLMN